MMPSLTIDARPDIRLSCRLSAGSAQARITTSGSPALPSPIPSRHAQIARSHRRIRSTRRMFVRRASPGRRGRSGVIRTARHPLIICRFDVTLGPIDKGQVQSGNFGHGLAGDTL
jgi:hypothetical protein